MVTLGSIFGGRGSRISYLFRSTLGDRCEHENILHKGNGDEPDPHSFFYICGTDPFAQLHYELRYQFNIDNIFTFVGIFVVLNDLRAAGNLEWVVFGHSLTVGSYIP